MQKIYTDYKLNSLISKFTTVQFKQHFDIKCQCVSSDEEYPEKNNRYNMVIKINKMKQLTLQSIRNFNLQKFVH